MSNLDRFAQPSITVTFTVVVPFPPGGLRSPAVESAARIALINLAKAYYENNERVLAGEGGLINCNVEIDRVL